MGKGDFSRNPEQKKLIKTEVEQTCELLGFEPIYLIYL